MDEPASLEEALVRLRTAERDLVLARRLPSLHDTLRDLNVASENEALRAEVRAARSLLRHAHDALCSGAELDQQDAAQRINAWLGGDRG